MTFRNELDFHNAALSSTIGLINRFRYGTEFTYNFATFFHPFVGDLIGKLNQESLAAMLDPIWLATLKRDYSGYYNILASSTGNDDSVSVNISPASIDSATGAAYSVYNWELFYHIPVMIAVHLTQNLRFAEAQNWFHLVFDPTFTDAMSVPAYPFWKFIGFRQPKLVENLVEILSYTGTDAATLQLKQGVINSYQQILTTPFDAHAVARTRPLAYMYYVVMRYLDNLIAWGDSLFRPGKPSDMQKPTIETINEATLCYVLAANLLGPKPQKITPRGTALPINYQQLRAKGMDSLGNALVDLEAQFPFNMTQASAPAGTQPNISGPLFGIGQSLYFCIPPNPALLEYWDIVADRLFKIRNCEDIEGNVIQLPLFDPPIDPGMLVKAAAAGIDVGSVVSGLNQPLGPVRSRVLIQKAIELAVEVRSFGGALLAALEKGDGEHLAALRQSNEVQLQQSVQNVRFLQWKQAKEATQSLLRSRSTVLERYTYYLSLFGQPPDTSNVPPTFDISGSPELTEDSFDDIYQTLVGQYDHSITLQAYPSLQLVGGSSASVQSGASSAGQLFLNKNEDAELNFHLPAARDAKMAASAAIAVAGVLTLIPDLNVNLEFWGLGASSEVFGGNKLSDLIKVNASILEMIAGHEQDQAGLVSRTAAYQRRINDWTLQANLAARELMQIGRQIIGSLIGEQVAFHEYSTAKLQAEQAATVSTYLQTKFTNEQLYLWMHGQLSTLAYKYYSFALDIARQAEQTMKRELMRPEIDANTYIQVNYWDSSNQGLLSGEALHLDVKRMELDYYNNNQRELEITRHVSLRQLDPLALISLRATGQCTFKIPEWLFDRECPGHYMRRIKNVGLSLPSVVGPYSSVNCTLTLQSSSVRTSSLLTNNSYARTGTDDDRFIDYYGSSESIVTSVGSNDTGMFETDLRDERFLPFEGSGVANSTWLMQLPAEFPPFDYNTIPDAILHLRYTARRGGDPLALQCTKELIAAFKAGTYSLEMLFLLRNDFPTEWAAFVGPAAPTAFNFVLQKDYFPYAVQGMKLNLTGMRLFDLNLKPPAAQPASGPLVALSAALNGPTASVNVSIPGDPQVLHGGADQVYLIIDYTAQPQS